MTLMGDFVKWMRSLTPPLYLLMYHEANFVFIIFMTGKLFYYRLPTSSLIDVKHISISEAGSEQLPEWLHFNKAKHEIIGIPFNKGLHFIQINVKYGKISISIFCYFTEFLCAVDDTERDDIFTIDITDAFPTAMASHNEHCVLRIKQTFKELNDVWRIISYTFDDSYNSGHDSAKLTEWIQKFSISRANNWEYSVTLDREKCDSEIALSQRTGNEVELKLRKMNLDFETMRIMRSPLENEIDSDWSATKYSYDFKRHHRRHLEHGFHATPVLAPDWMTLSTSVYSIDESSSPREPLSRHVIPSMISPTMVLPSALVSHSSDDDHNHRRHHANRLHTPFIYTTPVLAAETPTLLIDGDLLTPTPIHPTPTKSPMPETSAVFIAPSPSAFPDEPTDENEIDKTPDIGLYPSNKAPYLNKRIPKLQLTAGKYWKFEIPSDTFMDHEDGNTRRLKLQFTMSASAEQETPPQDFWIQFDHENQYLYALPTERNVGKYTFSLVAVDSKGAHVTEYLEIHVRQHSSIRAFTHALSLENVHWESFQFAFVIDAVSTLMKRITSRIYGESDLEHVIVQNLRRNDDETW